MRGESYVMKWNEKINNNETTSDLSILIAVRLSMEAVQHITSSATHMSQIASPNSQNELLTWIQQFKLFKL